MSYASSPSWCNILSGTDIFQVLPCSKWGCHVGVRSSEKLRETALGIQKATALFLLRSSRSYTKSKCFKGCLKLRGKLHAGCLPSLSPALRGRCQYLELKLVSPGEVGLIFSTSRPACSFSPQLLRQWGRQETLAGRQVSGSYSG